MAITRRPWRITHTLGLDGVTLETTEIVYYVTPAPDTDNPDLVLREQQQHMTVDHLDPEAGKDGKTTAVDLTVTQRTGIATGITNALNALTRVKPLNPGP